MSVSVIVSVFVSASVLCIKHSKLVIILSL